MAFAEYVAVDVVGTGRSFYVKQCRVSSEPFPALLVYLFTDSQIHKF